MSRPRQGLGGPDRPRSSVEREYGRRSMEREFSKDYSWDYNRPTPDRSPRSSAERDLADIQDPTAKFEKGRIQVLIQERVHIQKKTFTKWCNSFLEKVINICHSDSMQYCHEWYWCIIGLLQLIEIINK